MPTPSRTAQGSPVHPSRSRRRARRLPSTRRSRFRSRATWRPARALIRRANRTFMSFSTEARPSRSHALCRAPRSRLREGRALISPAPSTPIAHLAAACSWSHGCIYRHRNRARMV